MPKDVQELLDQASIREVMVRYCVGLDSRQFDMAAECFARDAVVAYEGFPEQRGREKIIDWLRPLVSGPGTMHFVGNQLVEVDGDRATMVTYLINHAWGERDGKKYLLRRGLRYYDDLARIEGRWQITRRTHKVDWNKEEALG